VDSIDEETAELWLLEEVDRVELVAVDEACVESTEKLKEPVLFKPDARALVLYPLDELQGLEG
jgi:hypothetical protein